MDEIPRNFLIISTSPLKYPNEIDGHVKLSNGPIYVSIDSGVDGDVASATQGHPLVNELLKLPLWHVTSYKKRKPTGGSRRRQEEDEEEEEAEAEAEEEEMDEARVTWGNDWS